MASITQIEQKVEGLAVRIADEIDAVRQEMLALSAGSIAWAAITGKPLTFDPAPHLSALVTDFASAVTAQTATDISTALATATFTASRVSDFNEALLDFLAGGGIVAGAGLTITYDDPANALTISGTGGGAGTGDVVGPGAATADALVLFNGTSGKIVKNSSTVPSANGLSLISAANYAAMRTALGLVPGTDIQAFDADLATWAGVTPSANGISLVSAANYAAMRTLLGLVVGTDVQAYDADLSTWATITPSANGASLVSAANYASMRTLLGLGSLALLNSITLSDISNLSTYRPTESLVIPLSDEDTAITTTGLKVTFRMPYAFNLTALPRASLTAASTSGVVTFDVKEAGASIFSTLLTVDANEKTSTTAATPAVVSDPALADDAEITLHMTGVGTNPKGAKITLIGTRG
jgi:hypothetical protein